jgi:hypothetical protein
MDFTDASRRYGSNSRAQPDARSWRFAGELSDLP